MLTSIIPSKLRGRAAAVALPRKSLSLPRTFHALVHSRFKLIKVKLEKLNYNFLLFLGAYTFNICYNNNSFLSLDRSIASSKLSVFGEMKHFRKSLPPPSPPPAQGCPFLKPTNCCSEDTMACALASPG
jgi:hypothetical protein